MKSALGLLLTAALLFFTQCTTSDPADGRTVALGPCPPEDRISDGLCGRLSVFEDREAETGRRIDLRIVVAPALSGTPEADPLFILAGGPGQAATEIAGLVLGTLRDVHRARDLVFVDQRGTGDSNPLNCELGDEEDEGQLLLDPMADTLLMAQTLVQLQACADSLPARPELYTTPIAMDDLDQVREALGYDVINLWGVSYGTRAALEYMRRHPERVRTAVLDGLAPPSIRIPLYMGRDGNRALTLMLDDCRASERCNAAFPTLEEDLLALLDRLDQAPAQARVEHPRTGISTDVTVTRTSVASVIRGTLYNPQLTSLLPLAIDEATEGRFEALAALSLGGGSVDSGIYTGMFLSIICSEDLPAITSEDRRVAESDRLFGTRLIDAFARMCSVWPTGELPAGYYDPVESDVPTLLLSGYLDPVTPPEWGERTAKTLTNSLHVTVPGAAHNAFNAGCLPSLIEEFIDAASVAGLDDEFADNVERPLFFDSPLGPSIGSGL